MTSGDEQMDLLVFVSRMPETELAVLQETDTNEFMVEFVRRAKGATVLKVEEEGRAAIAEPRVVSVSISGVNSRTWDGIGNETGFTIKPTSQAPLTAAPVVGTLPFTWLPEPESSPANRKAALQYLNIILPPPDGQRFRVKGTSDIALCTSASVKSRLPRNGLRMVMELKKNQSGFNPYQLAAELMAANVWSPYLKPIAVMTDLMDGWSLMWVVEQGLDIYTCDSRAEAIGVLKAFMDKEPLTPDSTRIAHELHDAAGGGAEAEVEAEPAELGGLLKRRRLPRPAASGSDNLDDLLDFTGDMGLSETDIHQVRCSKHQAELLALLRGAPELLLGEAAAEGSQGVPELLLGAAAAEGSQGAEVPPEAAAGNEAEVREALSTMYI
ncbi:hypothetical protein GPECTOR_89g499 [Gonium pectorale]|uniref:Uncharacterized protein n=1 Tax=Gonium pectorale TaxID=33097 RepID=A0A150G0U9_GONPE|nr:hypothetical protein GPECTOR_89g499 [Gonium pectorale]|eukprot:KXZ43479.1 hypothetical protein GPECTOR_89g499 [Gonium pectorale]